MKKLILTFEESRELLETGSVEIVRYGFDMLVEWSELFEEYHVTIISPYDKVILKDKGEKKIWEYLENEKTY